MIGGNSMEKRVKPLIFKASGGLTVRKTPLIGINAVIAGMMLILMALAIPAQPRDALFLGLMDDKGQPVQSAMEQAIRNAFAANPNIKLTDQLETQRVVREKERLGRGNIENFIPPSVRLNDSTIIIKGVVREFSFDLKRYLLLWGKINARIVFEFYFEDISGAARYQGLFSANAMKPKDLLLFRSAQKVVHISAVDRSELLSELQAKMVKEVSEFADIFFSSLAAGTANQKIEQTAEPADSQVTSQMETDSQIIPQAEAGTSADFSDIMGDTPAATTEEGMEATVTTE